MRLSDAMRTRSKSATGILTEWQGPQSARVDARFISRPGSLRRLGAARQQRVIRKVVANYTAADLVGALDKGVDNAGLGLRWLVCMRGLDRLRGLDGLREHGRRREQGGDEE
jgi:hypothetical protein